METKYAVCGKLGTRFIWRSSTESYGYCNANRQPKKWLKFVLFVLFFVMFQVQTLAKSDNTGVYDISINSEYVEFRGIYQFDNDLPCNFTVTSPSKKDFLDFKLYVNDSLELTEDFLKTYEDKGIYRTEIPCINVPNSKIRQTYKYTGDNRNLVSGVLYPFDSYEFEGNISTSHPRSGGTWHKAKITLPENTFPVSNSSVMYYWGLKEASITNAVNAPVQTGTAGEYAFQGEFILLLPENIVSSARSFFEGPRFSIIYPQKESLAGHPIRIVAQWERPPLVKFIFLVSFISILILTASFEYSKLKLPDYLIGSFTIFALQEGINQLVIPAGRPLTITLFELPIIIVLIAAFCIGEHNSTA